MAKQTAKSKAQKQAEQDAEKSPRLLSKEQLALRLQLSTRTVYRLWQEGSLPAPVKIGGSIRWRSDVVDAWIENDCQVVGQ
jgi:prophage regulatory protein